MSCIVLVGGIIGCGKTTFIKYICENQIELFKIENSTKSNESQTILKFTFDDICTMEEQVNLMQSLKGWRNFRIDLLMAAEYFLNSILKSYCKVLGPLTERSQLLLYKLKDLNPHVTYGTSKVLLFVEDNFYYRSMRYDWFQIARRANIGFAELFLHCPLEQAIKQNASRGYHILEPKIKQMMALIEFPSPDEFNWEKYSIMLDSSNAPNTSVLNSVIKVIEDATNDPAETLITRDKVEAQMVCSKNVIHQADNILRKLTTKKISKLKESSLENNPEKEFISIIVEVRQELLKSIKDGSVLLPDKLREKLQNCGIQSVQDEFQIVLGKLFESQCNEKTLSLKYQNLTVS